MRVELRTMKDLKEKTPDVMKTARRADVIITHRGKPTGIVLRHLSETELEGLLLLRSRKMRELIEKGLEDARAGRTVLVRDLIARLGNATK